MENVLLGLCQVCVCVCVDVRGMSVTWSHERRCRKVLDLHFGHALKHPDLHSFGPNLFYSAVSSNAKWDGSPTSHVVVRIHGKDWKHQLGPSKPMVSMLRREGVHVPILGRARAL